MFIFSGFIPAFLKYFAEKCLKSGDEKYVKSVTKKAIKLTGCFPNNL